MEVEREEIMMDDPNGDWPNFERNELIAEYINRCSSLVRLDLRNANPRKIYCIWPADQVFRDLSLPRLKSLHLENFRICRASFTRMMTHHSRSLCSITLKRIWLTEHPDYAGWPDFGEDLLGPDGTHHRWKPAIQELASVMRLDHVNLVDLRDEHISRSIDSREKLGITMAERRDRQVAAEELAADVKAYYQAMANYLRSKESLPYPDDEILLAN